MYNTAGFVDIVIDVVGYYTDHNHDLRYYTEHEVDRALGSKADRIELVRLSNMFGTSGYANVCAAAAYSEIETVTDLEADCSGRSFNASGDEVISRHADVGEYDVKFKSLPLANIHVQITATGVGATHCKLAGGGGSTVRVHCYDADGTRADSTFNVLGSAPNLVYVSD